MTLNWNLQNPFPLHPISWDIDFLPLHTKRNINRKKKTTLFSSSRNLIYHCVVVKQDYVTSLQNLLASDVLFHSSPRFWLWFWFQRCVSLMLWTKQQQHRRLLFFFWLLCHQRDPMKTASCKKQRKQMINNTTDTLTIHLLRDAIERDRESWLDKGFSSDVAYRCFPIGS